MVTVKATREIHSCPKLTPDGKKQKMGKKQALLLKPLQIFVVQAPRPA